MDETDDLNTGQPGAFVAQMMTAAEPESMIKGFAIMIRGVIEQAEDVLIDWGTARIQTSRVVDTSDGAEMIYFQMSVHIIDLRGDDDER